MIDENPNQLLNKLYWNTCFCGINRIQGKSVYAQAFALERLQSPVSYVGIDIVSRTILKTMYCTISNSTFDDESR